MTSRSIRGRRWLSLRAARTNATKVKYGSKHTCRTVRIPARASTLARDEDVARKRRRHSDDVSATIAMLAARAEEDPDKAAVIACIGQLVLDGEAAWDLLADGDIEVRLASGETYLLQERSILRIA